MQFHSASSSSNSSLAELLLNSFFPTNIIYLTAYPEYALDAWSTYAKGFLVKPLKKEALLKQISMIRESVIE